MIVVYKPADGEPEQYDARSLLASEASIVARTVDMKWPEVKAGLADEDLDAMRGVVWVLKKRHAPTLRFGEYDPGVDEMVTRYDKDEVEAWVDGAFSLQAADPDLTPERIVQALADVPDAAADPEHAKAYIEKCRAEAEAGKDPEPEPQPETSAPERKTSATKTSAPSEPSS
ncbi:hypothetical protein JI76_28500 [Streptomyces anulatus]|uniref:hypothetical protein n=1 Tax=Streptomyces anulatus TaxID=1892 RepID=UPI0006DA1506|nr:hypothetical protein [Streptomyces anulatus]KPL29066.1 hypothetical protein JI76_28500 [Streptomyces anulatus]